MSTPPPISSPSTAAAGPSAGTPSKVAIVLAALRRHGIRPVARMVLLRVGEALRIGRADSAGLCADRVRGKHGLEVGGPSRVFGRRGLVPIYRHAARMDNCNFAGETLWEGAIDRSAPFRPEPGSAAGTQLIREATALTGIAPETYDFVCSSHTLEHVANPLAALEEWLRVLRPGGTLILLLPHREGTFDHRRPVTNLAHIIEDQARGVGEDDLTHLDEILALHDLSRDPLAGSPEAFKARSLRNPVNRCLHHHVFDTDLAVRLVDHAGLQVLAAERASAVDIVVVCAKPASGARPDNGAFLTDQPALAAEGAGPATRP